MTRWCYSCGERSESDRCGCGGFTYEKKPDVRIVPDAPPKRSESDQTVRRGRQEIDLTEAPW